MIFLLFGEDKFQIHQKKEEILRELSKKNKNFEVFSFDLEIEDWDKIQTHFKSSSFFSPLKIIVLQNPEKNKKFKESFLQEIEKYKASRNLILIIIQEGKEKEFISLVKKYSRWWHFSYLQELELKRWIKDKFKKNSLQPDPEIVDFLVLKFGSNLWAIENEIQK
ncbi:hypothetical protein H5T58_02940, partial [Candidatus Parcubacteria bacterium]|nr:hypothetical protein [Candidatus Parcubacteria bacterium]